VLSYVLGRQLFDVIQLVTQAAAFLGWMTVLVVPPVAAGEYLSILLAVAWYTSGLGYLVSVAMSPQNALLGGIAVGLILGGMANGVAPAMHELHAPNPVYLLDWISYTRCALGLQGMGSRNRDAEVHHGKVVSLSMTPLSFTSWRAFQTIDLEQ
jgi:hypothetical protein